MCSLAVQHLFHRLYVGLCIALCALGIFLATTRPPLHAELFVVTPRPVNGSLQVIVCQQDVKIVLADGTTAQHCEYQVDNAHRIQAKAYHVSMGLPCVLVCIAGCCFAFTTMKEVSVHGLMSADLLFVVSTYSMELPGGSSISGADVSSRRNTLYRWECIFWGYVFIVHLVMVVLLASPVDVFDGIVIIVFQQLSIMYLCRPRQCGDDEYDGGGAGQVVDSRYSLISYGSSSSSSLSTSFSLVQGFLMVMLVVLAWNNFASIPHVYEAERVWALGVLVVMDMLLLVVHMYDQVPTMYTITMGRLVYVILLNVCVLGMFYSFKHRLHHQYSDNSTKMV